MEHYAGIDVSLESASLCVVDAAGRIMRETKLASEPEVLIGWFRGLEFAVARIGLEAGPLSQWLYAGMRDAGLPVELLEAVEYCSLFVAFVRLDRRSTTTGGTWSRSQAPGQEAAHPPKRPLGPLALHSHTGARFEFENLRRGGQPRFSKPPARAARRDGRRRKRPSLRVARQRIGLNGCQDLLQNLIACHSPLDKPAH
jgi:hypothetical protein